MSNPDYDPDYNHDGDDSQGHPESLSRHAKRLRRDGNLDSIPVMDPDATPRSRSHPQPLPVQLPPSASGTSSQDTSVTGEKRPRSGRSSPTKNLAFLQRDHVIEFQPFGGVRQCPVGLRKLRQSIMDDSAGMAIITEEDKIRISRFAQTLPEEQGLFEDLLESRYAVDDTNQRQKLGTFPPIPELRRIWEEAQYCDNNGVSEAEWNCSVQRPLLYAALSHANVGSGNSNMPIEREVGLRVHNVYVSRVLDWSFVTSSYGQNLVC
jgi:hypothetical protein